MRLKLAKNQANADKHPDKQHHSCLKIIHIFHQCYHPRVIGHIIKNKQTNKCVRIHEMIRLIMIKRKMKMLLICIKQHLSII